jgi:hypothetical protein
MVSATQLELLKSNNALESNVTLQKLCIKKTLAAFFIHTYNDSDGISTSTIRVIILVMDD